MNRNLVASLLIVLGLLVVAASIAAYSLPAGGIALGVALGVTGWLVVGTGEAP